MFFDVESQSQNQAQNGQTRLLRVFGCNLSFPRVCTRKLHIRRLTVLFACVSFLFILYAVTQLEVDFLAEYRQIVRPGTQETTKHGAERLYVTQTWPAPEADEYIRLTYEVREAMRHSWRAYKKLGWGFDEIKPLSGTHQEWMGSALTMVDALDSLWILGLMDEFDDAKAWIRSNLNFAANINHVNVFEVTIRLLGGLLSAYDLSLDQVFLQKAKHLGSLLLHAFDTSSGIPNSDINLSSGDSQRAVWTPHVSLSEISSLQLELNELSRLTNDSRFAKAGVKPIRVLHNLTKVDGLCPILINIESGTFVTASTITLGARGDSYYEYLLKLWVQTGKHCDALKNDYELAMQGVIHRLVQRSKPNGLTFVGELLYSGATFSPKMDHLVCFLPGLLVYGVHHGMSSEHITLAKSLAHTCYQMYERMPTGLSPEIVIFSTSNDSMEDFLVKPLDRHNLQRPETMESLYYLYRATKDPIYREWGAKIFLAFQKFTRLPEAGYAGIVDVTKVHGSRHFDKMESFWLAETLKYAYLLFNETAAAQFPWNEWVFNTEGHPLRLIKSPLVQDVYDEALPNQFNSSQTLASTNISDVKP